MNFNKKINNYEKLSRDISGFFVFLIRITKFINRNIKENKKINPIT